MIAKWRSPEWTGLFRHGALALSLALAACGARTHGSSSNAPVDTTISGPAASAPSDSPADAATSSAAVADGAKLDTLESWDMTPSECVLNKNGVSTQCKDVSFSVSNVFDGHSLAIETANSNSPSISFDIAEDDDASNHDKNVIIVDSMHTRVIIGTLAAHTGQCDFVASGDNTNSVTVTCNDRPDAATTITLVAKGIVTQND